jgi:hypothetical protein
LTDENNAVDGEASPDISHEGSDMPLASVASISEARRTRTVDSVVRAYFDSLIMEPVPDELERLVAGMR